MKSTFAVAFLVVLFFSLASCASNTATSQEQQKQAQEQQKQGDWGTVNTIENEGVR